MPSTLPDGDPAPATGELPVGSLASLPGRGFGLYLHVPFCATRCGYCDFNTYTLGELDGSGTTTEGFVEAAQAELDLAVRVLRGAAKVPGETGHGLPTVETVFVGGGTPTLLPPRTLVRLLDAVRERFPMSGDVEVTTEANPDSVTAPALAELAGGGYTRVSLGMQSSVPRVLRTLERTHDPRNVARAVAGARAAGLQVSLDLIYGTPGESVADWETSLRAAMALEPDHVSAYALVVEEGTRLARQVRRGEVAAPQDDDEAAKYERADALLSGAGFGWYEVSNWAGSAETRCRHNELYWRGENWWGIGPGAHSHIGGVRWWNVKHPSAYAARLAEGASPAAAREVLTTDQRRDEDVLLGVRLVEGLELAGLDATGRAAVAGLVADGLLEGTSAIRDARAVLTLRGRLLADTVVRRLLGLAA